MKHTDEVNFYAILEFFIPDYKLCNEAVKLEQSFGTRNRKRGHFLDMNEKLAYIHPKEHEFSDQVWEIVKRLEVLWKNIKASLNK
jgi:hypothetical protein